MKIREKRPELEIDGWLLHQDNASAHITLSVKQFLTNRNITVMGHPPYSSDLAQCDFFNFVQLNLAEREPILPQWKRFRQKLKIFKRDFQNTRSRTVTSNGSTKCRSV
ncbi:hypothetical protein TNCV_1585811 [Trichonephila clavipes]|nr:hypothetical protein TNCV_1585811 [Trichonephila clavipes]